jgi:hypothetical protein
MRTVDALRAVTLALPGAEERGTWGEITFRVRDTIVVICRAEGERASMRISLDEQAVPIGSMPETFAVAPYVGRFGWTSVRLSAVDPAMIAKLVTDAWRRTAPRGLAASFASLSSFPGDG